MALTGGPTVDIWPHPLTSEGRHRGVARAGATLREIADDAGFGARPVRAWIDGTEVPAELLEQRDVQPGEVLTLRGDLADAAGDVVSSVLSIAVIAASVFLPPLLGLAAGTLGAAIASAGIMVVGNLLINALVPPEPPRLDAPGSERERGTPVYSLAGGANRARHYAPLLVVLGRHRVFPDLAAAEYTTFEEGEQFLHQIFDWGLGTVSVTQLQSGPNALSGYNGVEEYWALGGGAISEIAGNVDTVAGADLTDTDWVVRTAAGCDRIGIDLVGRLFRIDDEGNTTGNDVDVDVRWSATGVEPTARSIIFNGFGQDQARETITIELGAVRDWKIEVRRLNAPSDDDRTYDDVAWTALRAYQPDTGDYAGRNRLGLRFQASGQLQGRLDRISGVVAQKIPVWDGTDWTDPAENSNPAWIYRWWLRGVFVDGRLVAGCGLPAARIDEDAIKLWGAFCDRQQLKCDFVIDRERSMMDILRLIARCGRGSPSWQTGRLGVVWDAPNEDAVGLIHPGNIVQGSLNVEWGNAHVAEEVALRYVEPQLDWQWNTIRRTVPGVTGTPVNSATVTVEGITSTRHAASEAGLLAARQAYHRRRITWEMSAEGLALARGDVVHVTHSLIDGGVTGRLAGGTAALVQLDRPVEIAGNAHLMVRLPSGQLHTSAVSAPAGVAGPTDRLVLTTPLPAPPDDSGTPLDGLWRLYDSADPPAKVKIVATEPLSDRAVRFVAIDEDPDYYAAAERALNEPVAVRTHGVPVVLWISASKRLTRAGNVQVTEVEVALTVAGAWEGGQIRVGRGVGSSIRVIKDLVSDDLTARWVEEPHGTITITAIPRYEGGLYLSGARSLDLALSGALYDIAPPSNFAVSALEDGTRRFAFDPPADPDLHGIVIRYIAAPTAGNPTPAWGAMTPLHAGVLTASPLETSEVAAGNWVFSARALSTAGELSTEVRVTRRVGAGRIGQALWLTGTGAPADALGVDGNIYLDTASHVLYQKSGGTWSRVADLSGADGASWHTGEGVPAPALGKVGDWYFRTGRTDPGKIYRKTGPATWTELVDVDGADGATWHGGEGEPARTLGVIGDWYFRSSNGYIYEKTGVSTWTFRRDVTGPAGINGATWHSVPGAPSSALGVDGDFALRVPTSQIYRKAGGRWSRIADLAGADGATWLSGSSAPSSRQGARGDFYFQTGSGPTAGSIWRKTSSSSWTKQVDIDDGADGSDGADGATWHSGSGLPAGAFGAVGDFWFRTSNGFVYEKTSTGIWTFRHDITGPQGPRGPAGAAAPRQWARLWSGSTVRRRNQTLNLRLSGSMSAYDMIYVFGTYGSPDAYAHGAIPSSGIGSRILFPGLGEAGANHLRVGTSGGGTSLNVSPSEDFRFLRVYGVSF